MLTTEARALTQAVGRLATVMGHDHPSNEADMSFLIDATVSELAVARHAISEAMAMGQRDLADLVLDRDPRVGYLVSYLAGHHHAWRNGSPPTTDFYLTWRQPITPNHAGHNVRFYNQAQALWKYHPLSDPIEASKLPQYWQPLLGLPERTTS